MIAKNPDNDQWNIGCDKCKKNTDCAVEHHICPMCGVDMYIGREGDREHNSFYCKCGQWHYIRPQGGWNNAGVGSYISKIPFLESMRKKGWTIGKRDICPECNKKVNK